MTSPQAPLHRAFALTGPSRVLDPRVVAVRADIADIRLADQVFAPHYVAAIDRIVETAGALRAGRDPASEKLADMAAGDVFELLDVTGDIAWGIAPGKGLVGYLPVAALGIASDRAAA